MSHAGRLVGDWKAHHQTGIGQLLHERVGYPVGDVEYVASQALQRLPDHDGARWTVRFGRSRAENVEPGGDHDDARVVGEETCGLTTEIRWEVGPKRRHTALVVPEDHVLDRHPGQDTTPPRRACAQVRTGVEFIRLGR